MITAADLEAVERLLNSDSDLHETIVHVDDAVLDLAMASQHLELTAQRLQLAAGILHEVCPK
jgi:hypothetical protein